MGNATLVSDYNLLARNRAVRVTWEDFAAEKKVKEKRRANSTLVTPTV